MARTKGWNVIRKAASAFPEFKKPAESTKLRAHPSTKLMHNRLTQPLQPLTYKLHNIPPGTNILTPLGGTETLPFHISRTHTGNLPVYSDFKAKGPLSLTVVRRVTGDVDKFKTELSKVVSNSEVFEKVGRVEIKGLHVPIVKHWLRRLGF